MKHFISFPNSKAPVSWHYLLHNFFFLFSPDTKRIFGRAEEPLHGGNQKITRSEDQIRSREQKTEVTSHRPQGVGFLIQNCRTLHEPVCTIQTKGRDLNQESKWWPTSSAQAPNSQKPKYSQNTTSRGDYVRHTHVSPLATRHSSNPHNYASKGAGKYSLISLLTLSLSPALSFAFYFYLYQVKFHLKFISSEWKSIVYCTR